MSLLEDFKRTGEILVKVLLELVQVSGVYMGLYLFKKLVEFFPVDPWVADVVKWVHSFGAVALIVIFIWYSVNDIVQSHNGKIQCLV